RDADAEATSTATSGGIISVSVNSATAEIPDEVRAYVADGGRLTAGQDISILSTSTADATATVGGANTQPSLGIVAKIGSSQATPSVAPRSASQIIEASIGAADATAGGALTVRALHNVVAGVAGSFNPANGKGSHAEAHSSGGSLGVAASGATAT